MKTLNLSQYFIGDVPLNHYLIVLGITIAGSLLYYFYCDTMYKSKKNNKKKTSYYFFCFIAAFIIGVIILRANIIGLGLTSFFVFCLGFGMSYFVEMITVPDKSISDKYKNGGQLEDTYSINRFYKTPLKEYSCPNCGAPLYDGKCKYCK